MSEPCLDTITHRKSASSIVLGLHYLYIDELDFSDMELFIPVFDNRSGSVYY